jgi:hypothetical protein
MMRQDVDRSQNYGKIVMDVYTTGHDENLSDFNCLISYKFSLWPKFCVKLHCGKVGLKRKSEICR